MGFFSDFTGASARSDIKKANNTATAALDQGYNTSQGYYDQAASSFDPYTSSGAAGQKMYGDLLGLNGDDARSSAQGVITSDPLWSGKLGEDTNAVLKNLNARGMGASGTAERLVRFRRSKPIGVIALCRSNTGLLSRGGEARLAHPLIAVEHVIVVLKQNTLTGERRCT